MDPNANLKEQEQLLVSRRNTRYVWRRLNELRAALITWLNTGGFAPDWSSCPNACIYFRETRKLNERIRRAIPAG